MGSPIERAPRVLVVDDEACIRTFAERALAEAGYGVVVASDGQALKMVETRGGPFDGFVVDWRSSNAEQRVSVPLAPLAGMLVSAPGSDQCPSPIQAKLDVGKNGVTHQRW
jgi:CheY-like chemotaxis protein